MKLNEQLREWLAADARETSRIREYDTVVGELKGRLHMSDANSPETRRMSANSFQDMNLFVYQLETRDERKSAIAGNIVREGVATGNACINYKVVHKCLNTVLRKARFPLDVSGAKAYLDRVLSLLLRLSASPHLYHRGLDIQGRYHFRFYDSMIVAAALEVGCTRLLTEYLQDGQVIETVTVTNQFATT